MVPLLFLCTWGIAAWVAGSAPHFRPFFFAACLAAYYACFQLLHYRMHWAPPSTQMGLMLRKIHFAHHFSRSDSNYGFLAGLAFDVAAFKTYASPATVVRVPASYPIPWLHDGKSIAPQFAKNFQLYL